MSVLSAPHFHDEAKAFAYLEGLLWPEGIICPHCGVIGGRVYDLTGVRSKPSVKNPEGVIRHGLKKCGECRKQFTVKVGTCFEHARLPLHKMLQAHHLIVSSKKGISSHQLSRILEIQYNSAWFLSHRIRLAMENGELTNFGRNGGMVEVDETYIGRDPSMPPMKKGGSQHKMKVLTLIDRDTGASRSTVFNQFRREEIEKILLPNISINAKLMTDEATMYTGLGREHFAEHHVVKHGRQEYVRRGNPLIHTNTVEGFFSTFKRGMKGVYQHCRKKHLHRYLAEFDFRYTYRIKNGFDDRERAVVGLKGIVGKRLMYRQMKAVA